MDIQYLLLLQQLRNSAGGWLTSLMMLVSHMATVGCLVVCVVIYWGINRRLGYWLVSNCISSLFFNNVIKLTVCVYRPWIRYPQLQPYQGAIESATANRTSCGVWTPKKFRENPVRRIIATQNAASPFFCFPYRVAMEP